MIPVIPVEDTPAIVFTNRTNPRPYRQNRRNVSVERQIADMEQMVWLLSKKHWKLTDVFGRACLLSYNGKSSQATVTCQKKRSM